MKKNFLFIALSSFTLFFWQCSPNKIDIKNLTPTENIRLNQLGYTPTSVKKAVIVNSSALEFNILDIEGNITFTGKTEDKGLWELSKETVRIADFSTFTTPGKYRLYSKDPGVSYLFEISTDLYSEVFNASIKAFYLQRASTVLDEKYAGKYAHPMAHPDDKCFFHPSSGKSKGTLSSPKGWYDAGDYNKYIVNAGVTVSTLLTFYENYPSASADNTLNIPESGNGLPDLLDEVKYELDWAETMQDADGGVFFKLTSKSFCGFVKPQDDISERFVVGKSTTSALNFAALFAQAGRVARKFDAKLAENYISKAKLAWNWAVKNPAVEFRNPDDVSTGGYGSNDFRGDFFWAAAELFVTTGESEYQAYISSNPMDFKFIPGENWKNYLKNLGYYALILPESKISDSDKKSLENAITTEADKQLANLEKCPYHQPLGEFVWGSNSDILDLGIIFAQAYQITNNKKYLDAAVETTDYIFGKNAVGISFVTGFGSKSTMLPHQRLSASDGVAEPLPGWLAGGPNSNLNDAFSERNPGGVKYTSKAPAKAYMDLEASYASNEIAINWNAPLVYMTGFLKQTAKIQEKKN
jgi:endoglucanase